MNKADLKEMVEKKGETFIDLCNFDITSIVKSIIERFTKEKKTTIVINFIYNFWGTGILKKNWERSLSKFFSKEQF